MTSDTATRPQTPEPHDPAGLALQKSEAQRAEMCTGCGNPLALDQRYCLNCGKRRGSTRIDFENYIDSEGPRPNQPATAYVPPPVDNRPIREVTPLMVAAGLVGLAVILILGVLLGRTGQSSQAPVQTPIVAATTAAPATTGTTTASTATSDTNVSFKADWPSGKDGFTVELATLPKDSSDEAAIETAKSDLLTKGATDVGALDSDEYASLDPGTYVLYSGVYDTKADADKALAPLKASFPDALVVEVSATAGGGGDATKVASGGLGDNGAATAPDKVVQASDDDLQALDDATGDDYEDAQKKLPPTIATPGEAPPKDDKAPGGGGDAVTIG